MIYLRIYVIPGDASQRDNLMFHRIVGTNISLNGLKTLATRNEREYTQGYVFTERPIRINEVVVVQVSNCSIIIYFLKASSEA